MSTGTASAPHTLIRGDSFSVDLVATVNGAAPAPGSVITCRSQVRIASGPNEDALVEELTCIPGATLGAFSLTATPAQTALWPTVLVKTDAEVTINGAVQSSRTYYVDVRRDVTR